MPTTKLEVPQAAPISRGRKRAQPDTPAKAASTGTAKKAHKEPPAGESSASTAPLPPPPPPSPEPVLVVKGSSSSAKAKAKAAAAKKAPAPKAPSRSAAKARALIDGDTDTAELEALVGDRMATWLNDFARNLRRCSALPSNLLPITGDAVTRGLHGQVQTLRRGLATFIQRSTAREEVPARMAATSLLILSEALTVPEFLHTRNNDYISLAVTTREKLIDEFGRKVWDKNRLSVDVFLKALRPEKGGISARRLSVLHSLTSLTIGVKDRGPSPELQKLSQEVIKQLDKSAKCAICLRGFDLSDHALIPASCGHPLHADCFWDLIQKPRVSASYSGCCRTCRTAHTWGPLARSNLMCTFISAVAPAVADTSVAQLTPNEIAEICTRIDEELRATSPDTVLQKLVDECKLRGQPLKKTVVDKTRCCLRQIAMAAKASARQKQQRALEDE